MLIRILQPNVNYFPILQSSKVAVICGLERSWKPIVKPKIIIIVQECSRALKRYKCLWSTSCGGVSKMLLVHLITLCVQLAHFSLGDWKDIHSSCYYHHQIGSFNLTHCNNIFRDCVPAMCVTSCSVTYCVCIPEKPRFCCHYYRTVYDECK